MYPAAELAADSFTLGLAFGGFVWLMQSRVLPAVIPSVDDLSYVWQIVVLRGHSFTSTLLFMSYSNLRPSWIHQSCQPYWARAGSSDSQHWLRFCSMPSDLESIHGNLQLCTQSFPWLGTSMESSCLGPCIRGNSGTGADSKSSNGCLRISAARSESIASLRCQC